MLVQIINLRHRHDREFTEVGVDNDRLRIRIADNTDPSFSFEFRKPRFKLGAEIKILQIVDRTRNLLPYRT